MAVEGKDKEEEFEVEHEEEVSTTTDEGTPEAGGEEYVTVEIALGKGRGGQLDDFFARTSSENRLVRVGGEYLLIRSAYNFARRTLEKGGYNEAIEDIFKEGDEFTRLHELWIRFYNGDLRGNTPREITNPNLIAYYYEQFGVSKLRWHTLFLSPSAWQNLQHAVFADCEWLSGRLLEFAINLLKSEMDSIKYRESYAMAILAQRDPEKVARMRAEYASNG